jgi:hypothetical protein
MRVWLDDVREMPKGFDVWAKDTRRIITLIRWGDVDYISFDHDLGEKLTGYDVAKFIEQMAYDGFINPIQWDVHSANPVGRKNIEMAMESACRFWREDGFLIP